MEFNPNATAAYLTGKIDEYVKFGGRDTLQKNASRDPAARYARIPDGGACDFCRMLGSRGFVYHTEETAGADGNDYHPHCNCQVAVTFQPDMLFYEKNGVTVSRGYQGSETYVVKTGRDGSDKLRKVDIDELYDEYLAMGKRFKSTSSYRSYPSHIALTQHEFDAAMKALEDAQTLEDLHDAGARIVDQWKLKSKGGALDDDQWRELSKRAKELEAQFLERENVQKNNTVQLRDENERRKLFDDYQAKRDRYADLRRQFRAETDEEKKKLLQAEIDKADIAVDEARSKMTNGEYLIEIARVWPAGEYIRPAKWGKTPSTAEIVKTLGGGDKTKGSCSSLALAYFGNKGGNIVRDFRGGSSCNFFSTIMHIRQIGDIDGVNLVTESDKNAFKAAEQAFSHVEEGKRYYFSVGKHSSVIEKRDGAMYYLELQTENENGWHELTKQKLKSRFGCTKTQTIAGMKVDQDAYLIEGGSLSGNAEFNELMGYINTQEDKQKKGAGGRAK